MSLHFTEDVIDMSKNVIFEKRDANQLSIVGIGFLCTACCSEAKGWLVTELFIYVRGKGLSSFCNKSNIKPLSLICIKWVADLLYEGICKPSIISNATMHKLIKGYVPDYTITKTLLKKTCMEGNVAFFGCQQKLFGGW